MVQGLDRPAYSLPGMAQNGQLSPTPGSVINPGHKANVPLIQVLSELGDGFEPHDHILLTVACRAPLYSDQQAGWVYPGWCSWGGYQEGYYTGYYPAPDPEAYLMNY